MATRGRLLGVGGIVALIAAITAQADVQPTTLEQLNYFYPSVSARQNAALVYQAAVEARAEIDYENRKALPVLGEGKEFSIQDTALDPGTKAAIQKELERNAKTLELLHTAAAMPLCRFPINFVEAPNIQLPHLAPLREFARLLEVQAVNAADDKNPELAAQAISDSMAIAQSLRMEPDAISQLVRFACWAITINTLEQVLSRIPLSEEFLQRFQSVLTQADDRNAITRACQADLCTLMSLETETPEEKAAREKAIAEFEAKMEAAEAEGETGGGSEVLFPPEELYASPKADPKIKQEFVQEAKQSVKDSRLPYSEIIKTVPPPFDPAKSTLDQYNEQNRSKYTHFPAMQRFMISAARNAAKAAAAQGALALMRYRAKTGKLPEKWEDLAPDFLPAPIADPFLKDTPLRFKQTETGFAVYSLGDNKTDDGGTEGDGRPPLDIVFRVNDIAPAETL